MSTRAPLFIVLEGIDGSGTTTQAHRLAGYLSEAAGRPALATREPSAGPVGLLLREFLHGKHTRADGEPVAGDTMALLFAADRKDHLFREVEPALQAGQDVVCDRYQWSSLAYQAGETRQEWVQQLARGLRTPDLTILIDIPIEAAAARRHSAGRPVERYDGDSYLAKVASEYRALAQADAKGVIIDGRPSIDDVTRAIVAVVAPLMMRESKKNERDGGEGK